MASRNRCHSSRISVERHDGLRGLLREIKKGTPFFYLPDQNANRARGVFVPFCGVPASTVQMRGRFAKMTDAVVIPTVARYLPRGQGLELTFDPPMEPFPSGDPLRDSASMNRVIEERIRSMPDQYFWVHRRFKTRPDGEPPIYASRKGRR